MKNNVFKLAPGYCLYNGAVVMEQNGSYVKFLIENFEDGVLKGRLKRAFENYVFSVRKDDNCPAIFRNDIIVDFKKGNRTQLRKYVSGLYLDSDKNDNCVEVVDSKKKQKEAAAIILLDRILQDARQKKATDIHIERGAVRFRINGSLEPQLKIQKERGMELIQRIKLLAGMNVIEKRKSQDGNFVYGNKNPIFVRVSSVSIIGDNYSGEESVVLRLLDTSRIPLSIDYLGFEDKQLERISVLEKQKNGLVIVCGPTGSGKSTTVASMLVEIEKNNCGKMKIISLEDPPEYVIPGVTQMNVSLEGNSFKDSLEHIFRQDPDVIMIGEIRDEESAAAALRASLTGHLVFATLHTGGVSEAVLRLENLGIDRNVLCSVLRGVICQELNYIGDELKLYADVGVPIAGISSKVRAYMGEDELDELFWHSTNYSEIFSKTLELLGKKDIRHEKIWKGESDVGKVHKRIV